MAKSISFKSGSFSIVPVQELPKVAASLSKDPHFLPNQTVKVKSTWGTGTFEFVRRDGTQGTSECVGIMIDNNGVEEFLSISNFKGITKLSLSGAEVTVNPNNCLTDMEIINAYTPRDGDILTYVTANYINPYNRPFTFGKFKFPTR